VAGLITVHARAAAWSPYTILTWLIGSLVACGAALLSLPASRHGDSLGPVGNDSFYHARRILDAIPDLARLSQFDSRMHAPEGSMVLWPWGYDFAMALIGKIALATGLVDDPMRALVFVPAVCVLIAIALVIGIARRLELSAAGTAVVVGCVALSPLTQMIHGVGVLDHHFVEYLAWLAALWAALRWLTPEGRARDAVAAGIILGVAPAFHTDLFVLQLPLVAGLAWLRLRNQPLDVPHAGAFAVTLLAATALVVAPSLAFRQGHFEFFSLSWFHVYAAAATSLFCLAALRLPRTPAGTAVLFLIAAVVALPGIGQSLRAAEYLAGDLELLDRIEEAKPVWEMATEEGGPVRISRFYSLLVWLAPLVLAGCVYELWRAPPLRRCVFWAASILGLGLLLLQFRFHNFGSLALYLPLVLWAERAADAYGVARKRAAAILGLVLLLAYAPSIRGQLFAVLPPGNDLDYGFTRALYPVMAEHCRREPGTVLAGMDDGHYIRYHTDCAVLANNFIITRQHERKIREVQQLLESSPEELRGRNAPIRYVFVRFTTHYTRTSEGRAVLLPAAANAALHPRLVRELLAREPASLPEGYVLLDELASGGPDSHVYARLFALR
jgi:hypothetical protein